MSSLYLLIGGFYFGKKVEFLFLNGCFPRQIRPDWGITTLADTAGVKG